MSVKAEQFLGECGENWKETKISFYRRILGILWVKQLSIKEVLKKMTRKRTTGNQEKTAEIPQTQNEKGENLTHTERNEGSRDGEMQGATHLMILCEKSRKQRCGRLNKGRRTTKGHKELEELECHNRQHSEEEKETIICQQKRLTKVRVTYKGCQNQTGK